MLPAFTTDAIRVPLQHAQAAKWMNLPLNSGVSGSDARGVSLSEINARRIRYRRTPVFIVRIGLFGIPINPVDIGDGRNATPLRKASLACQILRRNRGLECGYYHVGNCHVVSRLGNENLLSIGCSRHSKANNRTDVIVRERHARQGTRNRIAWSTFVKRCEGDRVHELPQSGCLPINDLTAEQARFSR
jgi:hypothetical protein